MNLLLAVASVVFASALAVLLVWALLRSRRSKRRARRSEQREEARDGVSLQSPAPGDSRGDSKATVRPDLRTGVRQQSAGVQTPAAQPSETPSDRSPAVPQIGLAVPHREELPSLDRGRALPPPGSAPSEAAEGTLGAELVQQAEKEGPLREAGGEDTAQGVAPLAGEAAASHDVVLPSEQTERTSIHPVDEAPPEFTERVIAGRVGGRTLAPAGALPVQEAPATDMKLETAATSLAPDSVLVPAGHEEAPNVAANLTASSDEVISGDLGESRPDEGFASAVTALPAAISPPATTGEVPASQPGASKEPPALPRTPRQYRPAVRAPGASRVATLDSEERAGRDRTLPIEVRLIFERAGFCRVSLLPRRAPGLPGEIAVSGSGDPPELIALQDEWYQDVVLPDAGALLRRGIEWEGFLSDKRIVRWSLSGREIYVLCRHGDLNGFVSTPRLILGEQHVVLCTVDRLQEVRRAIELTGSPDPAMLDGVSGMPPGWVGLRGVVPRTPVAPSPPGDILDALRPLADVEIVFEGGIRLERLTWLNGYPPRIRLRGDVGAIGKVVIDEREATLSLDGGYVVPGWDLQGQHQVWCASASRSYSIREGAEDWEAWDAYTWSMADFSADGERSRAAICGVLVLPPRAAPKDSRAVMVSASNPILLGAVPGQIQACEVRSDVRAETCTGFTWFDPVWAIPADALRCDKRVARVLLIGDPHPVAPQNLPQRAGTQKRLRRAGREDARRVEAWCSAILTACRKGLRTEPHGADVAALWQEYKRHAKAIWRSLR